jgi:hypothetical protein
VTASKRRRAKLNAAPSSTFKFWRAASKLNENEIGESLAFVDIEGESVSVPQDRAAAAAMRRKVSVQEARRLWELTKNPMYPWKAFFDAVKAGEPPPQWAADVLISATDALFALKTVKGDAIIKALGLKHKLKPDGSGRRSFVTGYRLDMAALDAAYSPRTGVTLRTEFKDAERGRKLLRAMYFGAVDAALAKDGITPGRPKLGRRAKPKPRKTD